MPVTDDDIDLRRRRAAYRALHRGTKELDALIGRFAVAHLPRLEGEALTRLETLIAIPDPTLQAWVFGKEAPTVEFASLVDDIRSFHGLDAMIAAAR